MHAYPRAFLDGTLPVLQPHMAACGIQPARDLAPHNGRNISVVGVGVVSQHGRRFPQECEVTFIQRHAVVVWILTRLCLREELVRLRLVRAKAGREGGRGRKALPEGPRAPRGGDLVADACSVIIIVVVVVVVIADEFPF